VKNVYEYILKQPSNHEEIWQISYRLPPGNPAQAGQVTFMVNGKWLLLDFSLLGPATFQNKSLFIFE